LALKKLELDVFADHFVEKTEQSAGYRVQVLRPWLQHLAQ
jgi:hypothetical protein